MEQNIILTQSIKHPLKLPWNQPDDQIRTRKPAFPNTLSWFHVKISLHVKIKYQSTQKNSQQCQGFTKEGQTPTTKSNFKAGKGTTMWVTWNLLLSCNTIYWKKHNNPMNIGLAQSLFMSSPTVGNKCINWDIKLGWSSIPVLWVDLAWSFQPSWITWKSIGNDIAKSIVDSCSQWMKNHVFLVPHAT